MNQRGILQTDLNVSTLCLGTMTFGFPVSEDDAIRIVHWAVDHGINFIDTADMYEGYARQPGSAGGVAESILGRSLRGRRDQVVITTKVGNDVGTGKGLGRAHMTRQLETSLTRMQTDHVELYELHRPDPDTPLDQTLAVIVELIEQGKVRHWGFSNFHPAQIRQMLALCEAHGWPRPVVSQPKFNWLEREVETEHLPLCEAERIAVTPYQPLAGGLLTGKYRRGQSVPFGSRAGESSWLREPDETVHDRIETFLTKAQVRGELPARYAVQWLLEQPAVVSVVVGTKSIEQLSALVGEE